MIEGLKPLSEIRPERVHVPVQAAEFYAVEYSARQDCFHVDELGHVLQMNRMNARNRNSVDYQIIAICTSDAEALDYCRRFKKRQQKTEPLQRA